MKIVFIALLALMPNFTAALSATDIDPKSDDIKLLKDQILGVNRRTLRYNNHTYEVAAFPEEWQSAKYYCKWLGMEMLSIESAEENEAIVAGLEGRDYSYYMSLNDNFREGDFHWESTGERVGPFINWRLGQPLPGSAYNCALFTAPTGQWTLSSNCAYEYLYICESIDFDCSA